MTEQAVGAGLGGEDEKPDDREDGDDGDDDHPHRRTELDLLVGLVFPLPVRR